MFVAELAPRAAVRMLAEVVRLLPLAAAVLDREMRYVAHNKSWLTAHGGHVSGSLVGKNHYDVFPGAGEKWRGVYERCLAGATERSDHDVITQEDGKREVVRWVVCPWRTADGSVGGIVIYMENITAQLETQRSLAERESLIRDMFECSTVGLNLCRMDGTWLQSNAAFLSIIGYSAEEAKGVKYWQLTPRKYDLEEAVQLESLRTKKHYGPYEKEFIRKDGSLVPVRLNGFIVERDGQELIWSLIEDLSSQRELEARLEEQRVNSIHASRLAMLGEMAASVAHEMNNPLAIISGYAYGLRDAVAQGNAAEIEQAIVAIEEAAARAGKIVHGLRKFSRHGSGDGRAHVELVGLAKDAVDLCGARSRASGVKVTVDESPPVHGWGNALELSQVLVNLLTNGIDAAAPGPAGWVRVSAGPADVPGHVRITVSDSGPRIPREVAEKLFRPFFTTKASGEGTGLGLSISRNIVEGHRGTLVYDADAEHTSFVVTLRVEAP